MPVAEIVMCISAFLGSSGTFQAILNLRREVRTRAWGVGGGG